MARAYRMTPARRRALRKAQLASARKRRKFRSTMRKAKSVRRQKKAYAKKNYRGRGSYARQMTDLRNSTGVYSTNWRGKKYGRTGRAVNRAVYYMNYAPIPMAISRRRGRKKKRR